MDNYHLNKHEEGHTMRACPSCGSKFFNETSIQVNECKICLAPFSIEENITCWEQPKATKKHPYQLFLKKLINQLHPLANIFLPFRHIIQAKDKKYYIRCLSDPILAKKWSNHYLNEINLMPGDTVLDHGCGQGRVSALCNQIGLKTYAQDIKSHRWWRELPNSTLQVVGADYLKLPWDDASFSAVLNFGVIHYMDRTTLENHFTEVSRVLKPGGYYVLWEGNSKSFAARMLRKQLGRVHDVKLVKDLGEKNGFKQISLSYEGFYAPFFPLIINFLRNCWVNDYDMFDFGHGIESIIPTQRRAHWLLKFQKPHK